MTDKDFLKDRKVCLRQFWNQYAATLDNRAAAGDVTILIEALERIVEFPDAPEMAEEITRLLKEAYVKGKIDKSRKHYSMVRINEILGLAKLYADAKITQTESHELIAGYYNMTADAVRKIVKRKGLDK